MMLKRDTVVRSMLGGNQFRLPAGRLAKLCRASVSDIAASGEPNTDAAIPAPTPDAVLPGLSGPPKREAPPEASAPPVVVAPPAAPKASEQAVSSFSSSGTEVPIRQELRSREAPRGNPSDRQTGRDSFGRGGGAPRGEGGRGGFVDRGRGAPRGGDREGGRGGWADRGRGAPRGSFQREGGGARSFAPRTEEPEEESTEHSERMDIQWAAEKGKAPDDVTFTQCGRCRASYVLPSDMLGETGRRCKCSVLPPPVLMIVGQPE